MFIKIYTVNAFIDGAIGGNPAGIVLNADSLSTQQKQMIAVEIGLSETSFVSSSDRADFKLEFFTPERQIAHCGQATRYTSAIDPAGLKVYRIVAIEPISRLTRGA